MPAIKSTQRVLIAKNAKTDFKKWNNPCSAARKSQYQILST